MRIPIVKDGWPWIIVPALVTGALGVVCQLAGNPMAATIFYAAGVVIVGFMIFFHRDPDRRPPQEGGVILAGADGVIRRVEQIRETAFLNDDSLRVSIFLSPFNVHVNRAPVEGRVTKLDYTPGRHLLTINNAASEVNEHSSILIEGGTTRCLVRQIVGPIVRRVVHWLEVDQQVTIGESIGMMRFGSRLDTYLPASDVEVLVKKGDKVRAGVTVIARIKKGGDQ